MCKERRGFYWMASIGGLLVAAGCAGPKASGPGSAIATEYDGAPGWVTKGCRAYRNEARDKRVICGVGAMGGTEDLALARSTALARARTDLARSLETRVESMLKDYQATTTGGQEFGVAAADEQHVKDVARQVTDLTLSGTELADSWISPEHTLYALVVLDAEGFKNAVGSLSTLSEAIRRNVIDRADQAFDDLDRKVGQRRAAPAR